ncbi:MAG: LamG-like jellyroll fold domain-containing protein [Cyanobacteria bacterium P01_H01_bin.150]
MAPKINISNYTTTIYENQAFGNAVSFDGVDDYVELTDGNVAGAFDGGSTAFTITGWIKPNSLSSDTTNHEIENVFLARASDTNNDNFELGITTDGKLNLYLDTNVGRDTIELGNGELTTGEWHSFALVFNSGSVTAYIDGTEYTASVRGTQLDPADGSPFTLGATLHGESGTDNDIHYDGEIDELGIWNAALTEDEINDIRYKTLSGDESNLVAYYNFNQDSVDGTAIADATDNGNDGTLTNGDGNNFVDSEIPTFVGHVDLTLDSEVTNPPGIIVNYQIDSGSTATQDVDFYNSQTDVNTTDSEIQTDSIFIPEGEDSARIYLTALPDAVVEGDETINLTLLPDFNEALDLDGVDDYVEVGSQLSATSEITIEAWVKPTLDNNWNPILNFDGWNSGDIQFQFDTNNRLKLAVNGAANYASSFSFESDTWYHVAVTYSASDQDVKFYVNGELSNEFTYDSAPNVAANSFKIGGWSNNNGNIARAFNGEIDEVRVWDTARSQTEIQDNIYVNLNGDESNLVAYYNFNEDTVDGTSITNVVDPLIIGDRSLFLNASNYVEISKSFGIGNFREDPFSVELWFQTNDSNGSLIGSGDINSDFWQLYIEDGKAKFNFDTGANDNEAASSDSTVNDGKWHHLVAVRDGNSRKLYLDGELVDSLTTTSDDFDIISDSIVFIGKSGDSNYFTGKIDEVKIWNDALSSTEVGDNYSATSFDETDSRLRAYYTFESDPLGYDSSGNLNKATPVKNSDSDFIFRNNAISQNGASFTNSLAYDPFAIDDIPSYEIDSTQSASITIQDNDAYTATIAIADVYGDEVSASNPVVGDDGTATFTVKLNSQPTSDTVINLSTSSGSLDSSSLTFTTNNWDTFQEVNVSGLNSSFTDFNVTASYSSGDTNFSGISQTVTIADSSDNLRLKVTEGGDELELTPTATIEATNAEATESSESGVGIFTVFLDTPAPDGGLDIPFTISPSGVTDGTYELFYNSSSTTDTSTSGILSIAGGETSGTITVAVEDNDLDEASKGSVAVTLSAGTGYNLSSTTSEQSATINLVDDDEPGIEFASLTTVTSTENTTIDSSTVDASLDYGVGSLVTSESGALVVSSSYNEGVVGLEFQSSSLDSYTLVRGTKLTFSNGAVVTVDRTTTITLEQTLVQVSFPQDSSSNTIPQGETTEVGIMGTDSTEFAVRLNSEPTSNVNITLTSDNPSEGKFSNGSATKTLTFTTENWDTYQEVEVFGVNDDIDDGNIEYTINAQGTSSDSNYNGISDSISVINQDNENGVEEVSEEDYEAKIANSTIRAGLTVLSNTIREDGTSEAEVQINLDTAAPAGGKVIEYEILPGTAVADDIIITSETNTIFSENTVYIAEGQTSATITVSAQQDLIAEYEETFDIKLVDNVDALLGVVSAYDSLNGEIGLLLLDQSGENTSASFSLEEGDVLTFNDGSIIVVNEDTTVNSSSPAIVSASVVSDSQPNVSAISSQSVYTPLPGDSTATLRIIDDNDTAKVLITDSQSNEITSLTTTEDGTSETFYVSLNSQPTENVVVYFGSGNSEEGLLSDSDETNEDVVKLVFTPDNWDTAQQVTINPVDDNVDDDGTSYEVVSTVISDDLIYNENSVALQVSADFDETDSTISLIIDDLSIKETELTAGTRLTFNDGSVVELLEDISLSNTEATDVSVDGGSSIASSATAYYQESISTDLTVTNTDNDTAGIIVDTYDTSVEEGYSNNFFNVKLATKPVGEVSITMNPTDVDGNKDYNIQFGDEFDGESYTVTFDETNWNAPQAIKVSAVDDNDVEYDHSSYVKFSVSSDDDSTYNSLNTSAEQVKINIEDNDLPTASVQTIAAAAEAGAPGYFVVTLDTPAPDGFDGTGIVVNYSVSGTVDVDGVTPQTDDLKPLTGSVRIAPGESRSQIIAFPIDDFSVEDDETVTVELVAANDYVLGDSVATLEIVDNDEAGVRIVEIDNTTVTEGGTSEFYVSLLSQPEDDVTITLSNPVTEQKLQVTAVSGNQVTLKLADDATIDSLSLSSGDTLSLNNSTYTVSGDYFVNDSGVEVTLSNANSITTSSSVTYSYNQLSIPDNTLVFTSDNWYQLQTVTLQGIDDNVVELGDFHTSTISYTIESNDENYDDSTKEFTLADQTVNIIDRAFDKENTYQSLSEGFLALQDSLDSLTLPVVGSLDGITPSFIEDLLDNIVDEVKATDFVTAETLQDAFNAAFETTLDDAGFSESDGFSLSAEVTDLSATNIEFLLGIEGSFSESFSLDSDLGLAALGIELETEGALDMSFDYGIDLGFGINTDDGFYVNTENTAFEVSAGLDASNSGFSATGNLGFLQLDITDTGTAIGADVTVTLEDAIGGDSQLTLSELDAARKGDLSDLIQYGFSGDATLALNAITSIDGNTAFPSFEFDLNSNMPIFNYSNVDDEEELSGATITVNTTGTTTVTENQSTTINVTASGTDSDTVILNKGTALEINGDTVIVNQTATLTTDTATNILVTVADDGDDVTISKDETAELVSSGFDISFNDITLDLGGFITDLVEPVIGYVNDLIEPFKPIIDVLQTEIELLDTLGLVGLFDQNGDGAATLIEVGTTLASGGNVNYAKFFDAVGGIIDLVESLEDLEETLSTSNQNLEVDFGDYTLTDFEGASDDVDASTVNTKTAGNDTDLTDKDTIKSDAKNAGSGTLGTKISNFFTKLDDLGISIPLLDDPLTAVNLLLGQDIDLIEYDIPELEIEFNISKEFPIFASIKGLLEGGFSVYSNLSVGFDTYGLSQWEEADFALEDSYLILDGLYLNDLDPDTDEDVDELTLDATVAAGVSASAVVAKAEVKGGITGTAALDIVDGGEYTGESDGKLRGSEVFGADSILDLFSLSGSLDAFLEAVIKVGVDVGFFEIMETVWEENISITLFEFELNASSGTVSQSYIEGATVFFDSNLNGIHEEGEPVAITDANGKYDLEVPLLFFDTNDNGVIDPEEGQIVTEGGTDSSSGITLKTPLMAAYGSQMVTPLTTLKQKLVEDGFTPEEAETQVKTALGLPDVNLEEFDPLAAMSQGDEGGYEVYKAHVKVQSLFTQASEFIKGLTTESGEEQSLIPQQAIDAIAQAIGNYQGSEPIDLNDETQLIELFQEPLEATINSLQGDQTVTEQLPQAIEILTQAMAYSGEQIDEGFVDVPLDNILETVAPVKQITQEKLPEELRNLGESFDSITGNLMGDSESVNNIAGDELINGGAKMIDSNHLYDTVFSEDLSNYSILNEVLCFGNSEHTTTLGAENVIDIVDPLQNGEFDMSLSTDSIYDNLVTT